MTLRKTHLDKLKTETLDVLVLGGGINGAVSASVLAGRGVQTGLIDKRDFAGFTSQQSSNLAWGGIKYMETMEFPLVRKLCKSRNLLMKSYPSSVQEIRFFTTIKKGFRFPPWFLYLGTLLYWIMGNGFTRLPKYNSIANIENEEPVVNTENTKGGFEYSDAYLHDNDARFVFNFIRSAMDAGCRAANYVSSTGAEYKDGLWHISARDEISGDHFVIRAKALINACGPFADQHNGLSGQKTSHHHVFSKGIHLIVNRITPHNRVLTFFADDGRLFFVIPMGPRSCIGTTDTRTENPVTEVTEEDRQFVLDNINARLNLEEPLTKDSIISERCGVRPLVVESNSDETSDWVQLSRKHAIDATPAQRHISIYGGKLTDCLNVGEEVCQLMENMGIHVPKPRLKWYGEPDETVKQEFMLEAGRIGLDTLTDASSCEPLSTRFWRRYGTAAFRLLEQIKQDPTQAELVIENAEYTRCELQLAAEREMIMTLDDFLRRRSKISLVIGKQDLAAAQGLHEACHILFGEEAGEKYDEYFGTIALAASA